MIRPSRALSPADRALVREAFARAGLDAALIDHPTPATAGRELWSRVQLGSNAARVLRRVVLPPPPRRPGDTVNVTMTIPADLAYVYRDAEAAGAPCRSALLARAMRAELLERGLPCPPALPPPPVRVTAAASARVERRERSRR